MQSGQSSLISYAEAQQLIAASCRPLPPREMLLEKAGGHILAEDIYAAMDIPSFYQSAMDGYALAYAEAGQALTVAGVQAAGSNHSFSLQPGTAVRIFTGAAVPAGADTVVIQENVRLENGSIRINDEKLKLGSNIRTPGSEIKKGELALTAGSLLRPAAIGFLAGMGIASVSIIPQPRVSILVTGNELLQPGSAPEYGKVYESGSFSLRAALERLHISDVSVCRSEDDPGVLSTLLAAALAESDIVLVTGGVSAGDYDFTVRAAENCGVQRIFHGVRQKPGKPFFFGSKEHVLFFGMPGNPASVLTCFYAYVLTALEKLTLQPLKPPTRFVPMAASFKKPSAVTQFLKGIFDGNQVHQTGGQESYKMGSFALANCLVVIPEHVTEVTARQEVEIHLLP